MSVSDLFRNVLSNCVYNNQTTLNAHYPLTHIVIQYNIIQQQRTRHSISMDEYLRDNKEQN